MVARGSDRRRPAGAGAAAGGVEVAGIHDGVRQRRSAVGVQPGDAVEEDEGAAEGKREEEAGGWCSAPAGGDYLRARAL